MTILIDTNEKYTSPETVKLVQSANEGANILITDLPCSDYVIQIDKKHMLLIERKTANDLLASIGDGRLFDQVRRMVKQSKWAAVVVTGRMELSAEGVWVDGEKTGWSANSVRGALMEIQWAGCAVTYCEANFFAHTIKDLARGMTKVRLPPAFRHAITFPPPDPRIEVLTSFPTIGRVRAHALVTEKGETLAQCLVRITGGKKLTTDGWGKASIDKVRETLGLKSNEVLKIARVK